MAGKGGQLDAKPLKFHKSLSFRRNLINTYDQTANTCWVLSIIPRALKAVLHFSWDLSNYALRAMHGLYINSFLWAARGYHIFFGLHKVQFFFRGKQTTNKNMNWLILFPASRFGNIEVLVKVVLKNDKYIYLSVTIVVSMTAVNWKQNLTQLLFPSNASTPLESIVCSQFSLFEGVCRKT